MNLQKLTRTVAPFGFLAGFALTGQGSLEPASDDASALNTTVAHADSRSEMNRLTPLPAGEYPLLRSPEVETRSRAEMDEGIQPVDGFFPPFGRFFGRGGDSQPSGRGRNDGTPRYNPPQPKPRYNDSPNSTGPAPQPLPVTPGAAPVPAISPEPDPRYSAGGSRGIRSTAPRFNQNNRTNTAPIPRGVRSPSLAPTPAEPPAPRRIVPEVEAETELPPRNQVTPEAIPQRTAERPAFQPVPSEPSLPARSPVASDGPTLIGPMGDAPVVLQPVPSRPREEIQPREEIAEPVRSRLSAPPPAAPEERLPVISLQPEPQAVPEPRLVPEPSPRRGAPNPSRGNPNVARRGDSDEGAPRTSAAGRMAENFRRLMPIRFR